MSQERLSALAMFSIENTRAKKLNVSNIFELKSLPNWRLKGTIPSRAATVFFSGFLFYLDFFRKPKKGNNSVYFLFFNKYYMKYRTNQTVQSLFNDFW